MVQEPSFCIDFDTGIMCNDTARIITSDSINLELLLDILNSDLFFFAMKTFYAGGGLGTTGVRMKHTFMESFPMPKINSFDKLYECYGLTIDEINYILNSNS